MRGIYGDSSCCTSEKTGLEGVGKGQGGKGFEDGRVV